MPQDTPHFPGLPPIDAYGNGGFRFADMSHRGSILIVPSGVYAWEVADFGALEEGDFERVLAEADKIDLLLVGTGKEVAALPEAARAALRSKGIAVETMDTGAAARTYNVLLSERRMVAAALIAVD
jgi:uncharacterized protein